MLKKIISIKSVGRFKNFSWDSSKYNEFKRYNLLYSVNGRGKSTLSSIFRSLSDFNSSIIIGRKTLGSNDNIDQEIEILHDSGKYTFKNAKWDNMCDDIVVFDQQYVQENINSGLVIQHIHKKNLYLYTIGEDGCFLINKIQEISERIKETTNKLKTLKGQIEKHIFQSDYPIEFDEFIILANETDIDKKIGNGEKVLKECEMNKEIINKTGYSKLKQLDYSINNTFKLIGKTNDSIHYKANQMTDDYFKDKQWIEEGLDKIENELCPFCKSNITNNEVIKAYRRFFDVSYQSLKKEIEEEEKRIDIIFSTEVLLEIQKVINENKIGEQFWKEFLENTTTEFEFEKFKDSITALKEGLSDVLNKKKQNIFERIDSKLFEDEFIKLFVSIREKIENYNSKIDELNKLIDIKKKNIEKINIEEVKKALLLLKYAKVRHSESVEIMCNNYLEFEKKINFLKKEKEKAKIELNKYTKEVFNKYEKYISKYLEDLCAEFKIKNYVNNYTGGHPSANYCLSINDTKVELGSEITKNTKPCFKNTLSSGDKSTLAFAFFLSKLAVDKNLEDKIVIIDDPISSLDSFRKEATANKIVSLSSRVKQIFVFSHDVDFLEILNKKLKSSDTELYQIKRHLSNESIFDYFDIEKETRGDYFKHYDVLQNYLNNCYESELINIARCIRPLLESNLRMRFPGLLSKNKWLGNYIAKIRECNQDCILSVLKDKLEELNEINEFSKKFHHGEEKGNKPIPIEDGELMPIVKKTLKFINC